MSARSRWDIFCTVVDNYGDIGVCWRLARQLVAEHGRPVRLWVDDLASFARLAPELDPQAAQQTLRGVDIRRWSDPLPETDIPDVVIEAFACHLPDNYLARMAQADPKPLWLNLEYLSAEDWVATHHALPSPHPRLPLTKYFYFPGFDEQTGGLLREAGLLAARAAFQADAGAQARFWRGLGLHPAPGALKISLFGYPNPALPALLDAWAGSGQPIFCVVPETPLAMQISEWQANHREHALTFARIPFLPQDDYDRLLWACDLNFVRGEDSFVRAQWAARPFVWHIYPQHDAAHDAKLDAFLARYAGGVALDAFCRAWNGRGDAGAAWPGLAQALPDLAEPARGWADRLGRQPDLASKLLKFSENKL